MEASSPPSTSLSLSSDFFSPTNSSTSFSITGSYVGSWPNSCTSSPKKQQQQQQQQQQNLQIQDDGFEDVIDCTLTLGNASTRSKSIENHHDRRSNLVEVPTRLSRAGSPACDMMKQQLATAIPLTHSSAAAAAALFASRFMNTPVESAQDLASTSRVTVAAAEEQQIMIKHLFQSQQHQQQQQFLKWPQLQQHKHELEQQQHPLSAIQRQHYGVDPKQNISSCTAYTNSNNSSILKPAHSCQFHGFLEFPQTFPIHSSSHAQDVFCSNRSSNPAGRSSSRFRDDPWASTGRSLIRTCAHCGTNSTPLWRNGPFGPKSLCNACGIRFKKFGRRVPVANNNFQGPLEALVAVDGRNHRPLLSDNTGSASALLAKSSSIPTVSSSDGGLKRRKLNFPFCCNDDVTGSESPTDSNNNSSYITWQEQQHQQPKPAAASNISMSSSSCNLSLLLDDDSRRTTMPVLDAEIIRSVPIALNNNNSNSINKNNNNSSNNISNHTSSASPSLLRISL